MLQAAEGNVEPAPDIAAIPLDIAPGIAGLVLGIVQGTVGAAAGTLELAPDTVAPGTAGTGPGRIPAGTQAAPGTAAPPPCRQQERGCRLSLLAGRWALHSLLSRLLPIGCHPAREVGEGGGRGRRRRLGRGSW